MCPKGIIESERFNDVLPCNYQKTYMSQESANAPKVQTAEAVQESVEEESLQNSQTGIITNKSLHEMEKESIIQALIDNRGIQTKAAAQLGMTARQIGYKIKKYKIEI